MQAKNMSKTLKNKAFRGNETPFHLLIPAAGNASRMGMGVPKPYLKVNGKAILRYTLEKFMNFKGLKSVSIVIDKEHIDLYHEAVMGFKNCQYVIGSNSRKLSVYNGLNNLYNVKNEDIILIHDAARPMVQCTDIDALLCAMENNDSTTLATPIFDTLMKNNEAIDRDNMWAIQTPQAFKYGLLKSAHEKFKDDDSFTDDAGLMRAAGHNVKIVTASRQNIKITTPEDFEMVKLMIIGNTEIRTAFGYDVHAFEKESSARKLMLGGIAIKHPFALVGHSDADVVLHAITDSILGAINQGDIGTHFPPSDPQWKNADSALFLQEAMRLLKAQNGTLKFIDVTILAEEPKIGPHRQAMQMRISEIMGIEEGRISIKATTTEGLGFTGRKEGIATQALATVQLPVTQ